MKRDGFTLVELIAMIIIIAVIMVLSFSSMTSTLKKTEVRRMGDFEDKIINAATIYVETNLKDFDELLVVDGTVQIPASKLVEKEYLDEEDGTPSFCTFDEIHIIVTKMADKTLDYQLFCGEFINEN